MTCLFQLQAIDFRITEACEVRRAYQWNRLSRPMLLPCSRTGDDITAFANKLTATHIKMIFAVPRDSEGEMSGPFLTAFDARHELGQQTLEHVAQWGSQDWMERLVKV